MSVNQHTPVASQYGQSHPGYSQPSYAPLDGGYPSPYAPYNGPVSAYQPGAPPQGKVSLPNKFDWAERELQSYDFGLSFYLPLDVWFFIVLCLLIWISPGFTFLHITLSIFLHLPVFAIFFSFVVFQVILLSQAFPLRLWLPTQSQNCPLLLT